MLAMGKSWREHGAGRATCEDIIVCQRWVREVHAVCVFLRKRVFSVMSFHSNRLNPFNAAVSQAQPTYAT